MRPVQVAVAITASIATAPTDICTSGVQALQGRGGAWGTEGEAAAELAQLPALPFAAGNDPPGAAQAVQPLPDALRAVRAHVVALVAQLPSLHHRAALWGTSGACAALGQCAAAVRGQGGASGEEAAAQLDALAAVRRLLSVMNDR